MQWARGARYGQAVALTLGVQTIHQDMERVVTTTAKLKQTWQQYAQVLLYEALQDSQLTHKQLSELLQETHGMAIGWKVLGRKIGRGNFDAGFFFAVMAALQVTRIDMAGAPKRLGKPEYQAPQVKKKQTWMPR